MEIASIFFVMCDEDQCRVWKPGGNLWCSKTFEMPISIPGQYRARTFYWDCWGLEGGEGRKKSAGEVHATAGMNFPPTGGGVGCALGEALAVTIKKKPHRHCIG